MTRPQAMSGQDALHGTVFDAIDKMPLMLYYSYEKSPKKFIELKEITNDLKQFSI